MTHLRSFVLGAIVLVCPLSAVLAAGPAVYFQRSITSSAVLETITRGDPATLSQTDLLEVPDVRSQLYGALAIDPVRNQIYWNTLSNATKVFRNGENSCEAIDIGGIAFTLAIDPDEGKIYWDTATGTHIQRANLDGSDRETVYFGSGGFTRAFAIDLEERKLYAANASPGTAGTPQFLHRANLDGSLPELLFEVPDGSSLTSIAAAQGKVYWSTFGIWRADPDGSNAELLINDRAESMAIDTTAGKLYWLERLGGALKRANLDGTQEETLWTESSSSGGMDRQIALDADGALNIEPFVCEATVPAADGRGLVVLCLAFLAAFSWWIRSRRVGPAT